MNAIIMFFAAIGLITTLLTGVVLVAFGLWQRSIDKEEL